MTKALSGIRPPKPPRKQVRVKKEGAQTVKPRKPVRFIMIDGEGVNAPERDYFYIGKKDDEGYDTVERSQYQMYTLLCASTGEDIENPEGLSTGECLSWLCNLALKYPDATFIVYGGSYDLTMWLRDLSFKQWSYLHSYARANDMEKKINNMRMPETDCYAVEDVPHSKHVTFGIDYTPRKTFDCYRYEVQVEKGRYFHKLDSQKKRIKHGSFHLYDVIGFFQCSFVNALKEYGILQTIEDQAFLEHMKKSREKFIDMTPEMIKRYCHLECELGVRLMDKLNSYLLHPEIDLHLNRWDGAGAIASAMMKKYKVIDHIQELPEDVLDHACHAYSGGRIELIQYGHTDAVGYGNDVNSAYPSFMKDLPTLKGGRWEKDTKIRSDFALCHVKWNLRGQRIYPFFYRSSDGSISYPESGEGWYWLPEYLAALRHKDLYEGSVELIACHNFYPASEAKPFRFINEIAALRLQWKREFAKSGGIEGGQNVAAKLGLNSLYGKTAQQVGGVYDEETKVFQMPKYHNMFWAGWVTSCTRAAMYAEAMERPETIIMFATDGLFTTERLDLSFGDTLGTWEETEWKGFTAVQSGVYYYSKKKKEEKWEFVERNRGFEKGSITELMVLKAWEAGRPSQAKEWQVVGSSKGFVTFGKLATGQKPESIEKNFPRLACWEKHERILKLTPTGTKREHDPLLNPIRNRSINPGKMLIPTNPLYNEVYIVCGKISQRYEYLFLKPVAELTELDSKILALKEEKAEWANM